MKNGIRLCAVLFALVLTGAAFAAGESWCPAVITVDQKAVSPPPDWTVSYSSLPQQLEMVTFFSGPPAENASLVYDKRSKTKGGWTATWNFPKDPSGYWIRCSYTGTRAELSKRLPDSVGLCRVTYDGDTRSSSGLPVIRKIECR